ncbi:hypothetical protein E5676_scaffold118G00370 [Cucumis melo var. makuwa]|uniref:Uncharacterized protein n=1 Tax=Cucumis melo var. makuwa TaxID=1194695 RepID=A0A5A7U891_CUCMM|nr:hypothetical protein E6C27_scaffold1591G00310 [Cucumis melo var. makuwa]TYK08686.1 hypothetical protein E5676_scaffold118G00370 [Cucumis melo var. makuwa]
MSVTLEEEIKEHKDKSDSSKSDHHWKRSLKKVKVSGDDPDGRGSNSLGVPNVPPLVYTFSFLKILLLFFTNDLLMFTSAIAFERSS